MLSCKLREKDTYTHGKSNQMVYSLFLIAKQVYIFLTVYVRICFELCFQKLHRSLTRKTFPIS